MIKKWTAAMAGCILSLGAIAGTMGAPLTEEYHPWSFIGSIGYNWYENFYNGGSTADASAQAAIGDGQTALGRFARDLSAFKKVQFGIESGVQNGNTARLNILQSTLDDLAGLPPQVTVKPMLDLLATASWQPIENIPILGLIKPGIAYRRLQVNDRVTFNDLSEVTFELQAG